MDVFNMFFESRQWQGGSPPPLSLRLQPTEKERAGDVAQEKMKTK